MGSLTILIPTLGRPSLISTLKQLSDWREYQPSQYQNFNIVVFHNSKSASSRGLTEEMQDELMKLNATLFESTSALEGAELSFRKALSHVKSGYVLPISDDNQINHEGLKIALSVAAEESYDWVHFNSVTNDHVNYLVEDLFYNTSSEELVSRIGLNYSICCISRSLFRVELIDYNFWDKHLAANRSVFSWSLVLAKSFQNSPVALISVPIEVRTVHEYDTSMKKWHSQWREHATLNNDGYLFPFTIHLREMYNELIKEKVISEENMHSMVVMEGNVLKPLYVELTNLTFLHANTIRRNGLDTEIFLQHIKSLKMLFPRLSCIYDSLISHFDMINSKSSRANLRKIEFRYRELVGYDGFKLSRIMGNSSTNLMLHPLGYLYVNDTAQINIWWEAFFIFTKKAQLLENLLVIKNLNSGFAFHFSIRNDPYFQIDNYNLVFPQRIKSRLIKNKLIFYIYRVLPRPLRAFLRSIFIR